MYYESVFKQLNKFRIKYVVIGGIAVNLYGFARLTMDLDIIVDMKEKNLKKLLLVIKKIKYKPRLPEKEHELTNEEKRKEWHKQKKMFVFTFYNPKLSYEEIDILLIHPISFKKLFKDRKIIKPTKSIRIPVASLKHLIKLKKITKREKDLLDLSALKQIMKSEL